MKFKKFLTESDDIDVFLKDLKSNCSEFLSQTKFPLWRGLRSRLELDIDIAKNDRKPKDSANNLGFNNTFNLAAEKITGIELIRKKAYFCSNVYEVIAIYGKPYIVFPSNGCNYFYSPGVSDSLEDLSIHLILGKLSKSDNEFLIDTEDVTISRLKKESKDYKTVLRIVDKQFDEWDYTYTNNQSEIKSKQYGSEILCVGAKKYFIISLVFIEKFLKMKDDVTPTYQNKLYKKLLKKIDEI